MNLGTLRKLTILFPLSSLLVSSGIVWHQYARRDRLARELAQAEREFVRLQKRLPKNAAPAPHSHDQNCHHSH